MHMYIIPTYVHSHTPANPAVNPQVKVVEAQIGHEAELGVFVSTINGPPPQNALTWYWPSGGKIQSSDPRVTFPTSRYGLILSELKTNDSGRYVCKVLYSLANAIFFRGTTTIQLKILGRCSDMFVYSLTVIPSLKDLHVSCRNFSNLW